MPQVAGRWSWAAPFVLRLRVEARVIDLLDRLVDRHEPSLAIDAKWLLSSASGQRDKQQK
jgi:hypothetical protein